MILRELRERKRISQQALGELFEVSAQTINNWECGKAEPDFEALMGLALFFGVSVDTLIGFDVKGNASTLRSCPFCGGRARIITGVSTSGSLKPSAHIKCEDCLAETAWAEDVNSDGTFIDEAKRRWNMRIHKIGEKHNGYIPLIPNDIDRYIEVCGGAGWVLFGKEKKKGQMEVFNDVDGDLINLYRQIKNNCADLQYD